MNNAILVSKTKGSKRICITIPNGVTGIVLRKILDDHKADIETAKQDILIRRISNEVIIPINLKSYERYTNIA